MNRCLSILTALIASCLPALAQTTVRQSGNVTPAHAACWTTNGIVQDCGTAAIPYLASIGTVGQGQTICAWSALSTAPGSQKICFAISDASGAQIVVQNYGIDTPQNLNFVINGVTYPFPYTVGGIVGPNSSTVGDVAIWNNTTGSLLKDIPPLQIFGTQSANTFLGGPTTGSAAFPTYRALASGDVPWSIITSTPTTIAGYGITNARTQILSQTFWVNSSSTNTAPCGSSGASTCSIGNDSNSCLTALTACLTAQHVANLINTSYDAANTSFGLNLADTVGVTGSTPTRYVINCSRGPWIGTSVLGITGNVGTPGNVQIQPANGNIAGIVANGCTVAWNGIHFIDSAGSNAVGFIQTGGGHGFAHVDLSNSIIDACAACSAIESDSGSSIAIGSGNSIVGNVFNVFDATGGGVFDFNGNTVAVSNNLTFTEFADANTGGQYKGITSSTFGSPSGITGTRCNIQGAWTTLNLNPNNVFPGNADCVIQETIGAVGLQKGAGGSSTVDYGTSGQCLTSGGSSSALDTWVNCPTYAATTWTPAITTTSTVGTPAYTTQVGSYEKIGRQVTVRFDITLSGWTGSPTGNVEISGLPVAAANTSNDYGTCAISNYTVTGLAASNIGITGLISPNTSVIILYQNSNTASSQITAAQAGTTATLIGFCNYHT